MPKYILTNGAELTITSDGLSSITLPSGGSDPGRKIANGKIMIVNGGATLGEPAALVISPIPSKSISSSSNSATVIHNHGTVVVTYEYVMSGNTITVTAKVENKHTRFSLDVPRFQGLTFDFGSAPTGYLPVWHTTYLQANGVALMHPSSWVPIGANWGRGSDYSIGFSPLNVPITQGVVIWDWDWVQQGNTVWRAFKYNLVGRISPGCSRTFKWCFTIDTNKNADITTALITPYKPYLNDALSGYGCTSVDHRPSIITVVSKDAASIIAGNPYGMYDRRRLDSVAGATEYCDWVLPAAARSLAKGVVIWAPGGYDARECMYRPDFDVWPPEVEAAWPTVVQRFEAANVKLGMCARPGEAAVRQAWKIDAPMSLSTESNQVKWIINRFNSVIARGCGRYFYLDTFGMRWNDVFIARSIVDAIGRGSILYAEKINDVVASVCGGYQEVIYNSAKKIYSFTTMSGDALAVLRWIWPNLHWANRIAISPNVIQPGQTVTPLEWSMMQKMDVMIGDWEAATKVIADHCALMVNKYMNADGSWK